MQLMNFDINATGWEQQLVYAYFDDDPGERSLEDVIETYKHNDDDGLLDYILDELEVFDDDELVALVTPFSRAIH